MWSTLWYCIEMARNAEAESMLLHFIPINDAEIIFCIPEFSQKRIICAYSWKILKLLIFGNKKVGKIRKDFHRTNALQSNWFIFTHEVQPLSHDGQRAIEGEIFRKKRKTINRAGWWKTGRNNHIP